MPVEFYKDLKRQCSVYLLRWNQDSAWRLHYWFLAAPPKTVSLPSLPRLATDQICPRKPREGHGGWSLFPTRNGGHRKVKFLWPGTPQGPSWFHTKERQVKERSLHKDVLSLTVPDSLTVRGCSISFLCPNFNIFIGNAQTDQLFRCICKIWNKTQSGLFLFFWPNVRV